MNADQREQVRDNARYLREVRPIDPDEIHEYVEGQPHPAAVRQVLRELAPELDLIERGDGTFEPASLDPVAVAFDGVERLPPAHVRAVEDLLVDAFGPDWHRGESGDRLRERVREVKARYLDRASVEYDRLTALGYAVYHLPATYAAAQYVLGDLVRADRVPARLRVLDVGAGVGGPALGLLDLLPEDALVEYHAVEPSAAADVCETLLAGAGRNVHATIHRETAEAFDPDGEYDLLLFANVLNELDAPAETLERYLSALAPAGTAVAIEPADRNTATGLRTVERAVADDGPATVYAPTVRLWPNMAPESECWSFDVRPDIEVPPFQSRLDETAGGPDHESGEFVNADVQYAYSLLTMDGETAIGARGDRSRYARMADADDYVTDRVNLLAIKLSHDLAGADANPLYLLGDGSQRIDHYAVLTERSALNDGLEGADYGDLLVFENALVLWNDDEGAYNVVVDGETVVDVAPT
ncbi:MAG: small ribosomal subunit Rsm22 family protein [Haloarculaceae archaeon]